jgi:hypothetical protein
MDKNRKIDASDAEERKREIRDEITAADDTGLIAGEELITEAETVLPLVSQRPETKRDRA